VKELAEGVFMLDGFPPGAVNIYLVGETLIDAGTRQAEKRIVRQIDGRPLTTHALTHAHPDHQGSSHAICERFGIPLWCGQADVPAVERAGGVVNPKAPAWLNRAQGRWWTGPPHPVARALSEGDEVEGFTVLETPGHSRGHISFWREADRVLILGDVLTNLNMMTGRPGLNAPPDTFTPDPARNRASARRLAALRPALACFGHGKPLRDPDRLADFVVSLPAQAPGQ
jgi:glyoxylase-like metal-dependent hydrolase (beta-lactamase superfamily II)